MNSRDQADPIFPTRSLIGGTEVSADPGAETFRAHDADTRQPLSEVFVQAASAQIADAVRLAGEAAPTLAAAPPRTLASLLSALADRLEDRRETISHRCRRETGYDEPRVAGEFARCVAQVRLFATVAADRQWTQPRIDHADPDRRPIPKPDMRRYRIPIGPVAVFGAANFPLAISVVGNDTVAAFAVGCPVVVKAHPRHPGTCALLGQCVVDAVKQVGLPAGTFSLIQAHRHAASIHVVEQPGLAAVGFTGGPAGGRAIASAALNRTRPIPVFAELGSTNPVFVLPSALSGDTDRLAVGFVQSLTFGNGQMCTRPGVFVAAGDAGLDAWVEKVLQRLKNEPRRPLLHAGIQTAFDQAVTTWRNRHDAKVLFDANADATSDPSSGFRRGPVLMQIDADDAVRTGAIECEVFGPFAVLVRCRDVDAWMRVADAMSGSLTATIHVGDADAEIDADLLRRMSRFAGRVVVGGWPTGVEIGHATHHGGPFPASLDGRATSIGTASVERFTRPVCFQNVPQRRLPPELRNDNPLRLVRLVDGRYDKDEAGRDEPSSES